MTRRIVCLSLFFSVTLFGMENPLTEIAISLDAEIRMNLKADPSEPHDDTKIPYIHHIWMYKKDTRRYGEACAVHFLKDKDDGDIVDIQYDNGYWAHYRCNQKGRCSSGKSFKEALEYVLDNNKEK